MLPQPTTTPTPLFSPSTIVKDLVAGLVVFLVALPLCLGIALASGADLFSGLLSGIVGGIIVAAFSGSQTSVSGPAAGLTAIVAAQIALLGSFEAFLLAVTIAGLIQIGFGVAKGGALSAFFPSSVIKGLLVAIGVILILKQIPHVVGHDADPEGEMSFNQPDNENTFTELFTTFAGDIHQGAMVIGLISIAILLLWDRIPALKKSLVPAPLLVVIAGTGLSFLFQKMGGDWTVEGSHLVQIPIAESASEFIGFLRLPDFKQLVNPAVYLAAITIAVVASLETLLNLEAVDKIDPEKRNSPPSRELIAQGCGNLVCGMIGGLPVTSVIVRGSVNVNAGNKTKLSAMFHGVLLLIAVALLPKLMNMIPLSALAAILLVTGFKLASPTLFKQMWKEGRYQFIPFIVTVVAIVMTDLLVGILIGLGVAILFILNSNLRRPIRRVIERRLAGDITHIELANQVSFLNRAAVERTLNEAGEGTRLVIDATESDYIDPDVLSLIRDFTDNIAPKRNVLVNLVGFRTKYELNDVIQFADYTTRELQEQITADQVIDLLQDGNARFVKGTRLNRDLGRQVNATAAGQNPLAAILSCIDSRVPTELVFDLGVGDIFSVRVAGNVVGTKSLGSIEYAVAVAGVKLVMVLGHTRCGAVTSSVQLISNGQNAESATGCQHLQSIVDEIAPSVGHDHPNSDNESAEEFEKMVDEVARRNVLHTVSLITERSDVIAKAVASGQVKVVGAIYDVKTGHIDFLTPRNSQVATA
ncbi:carbonic anhydrase/sulfate permease, SulP family [Neorhodopirellula lusitana]|uniref:Carbonic anhydrase/sulfate permease, SulP family n=1 Tax=Neorhodopirellula lusitana TaxID=445327 RepID=A0ABY1QMI6_9BACT|nr:SulP family inorganic anion transporter [Neorhodopirellula lusitana]SMP73323.1 carbonic anhydrase/sulfate permease, SulP family [Neorhodopirellula lusitana]